MPLAEDFQAIVDSLPSDWTDLTLDLRVDEQRYVDAASLLAQVNVQPYSRHDWHFRILVAIFDDLLLGSNVLGMLRAAGHEAELAGAQAARPDGAAVLVVDLASPGFDGVALVEALRRD